MILADILFKQGFGTRYDCRSIAASGAVSIDGRELTDPDEDFDPEGLVLTWRGMQWPVSDNVLIAMNKPTGYECSLKPSAHPSVMNLLPGPLRTRGVQPVGRLDWDTTGLLLFTDNGALLHRLTHPKKHVNKVYRATLSHPAANGTCEKLLSGVVLDDDPKPVFAKAAELTLQADAIVSNDYAVLPLYYKSNNYLMHDNISGFYMTASGNLFFKDVKVG
jgi:16S rRNA pseudouridine516 synthase